MEEKQPEAVELLVSVLIVTRNTVEPLRRCLEALEKAPDRASFEVLVVDNGSRDGCQSIDSEFPEVTVLRLPHLFGLTKARNIGIRTAKAEHLLLLSPYVVMPPGGVTALAARLRQETGALAVCPLLLDASGTPVSRAHVLPTPDQVKQHWRDPSGLPTLNLPEGSEPLPIGMHDGHALLIRRQTIVGINYLDERYGEAWIDAELAWQIRRAGRKILLLPDLRAELQPVPARFEEDPAGDADFAAGASSYIAKNAGWFAGFLFHTVLVLGTLAGLLTFRRIGYRMALVSRLLSGGKIDGTDQQL
ncbi:MAG: glycosyltransferase [Acidobacteriia bacterium]|nr:glycosyltransferase [Terriglobia bacterium]